MLKVTKVIYAGDYTLFCTFNTGEVKEIDFTPLLKYPAFEELKDKSLFTKFELDGTTISWENGADIASEWLYENGFASDTAYIISSPEMMADIRQAEEDIKNGKAIMLREGESLEDFLDRIGND